MQLILLSFFYLIGFTASATDCGGYMYVSTTTTITLPNSTVRTSDCVWDLKAPSGRFLIFILPNPAQLAQSLQISDLYTTRTFFSAEFPSTTSLSTVASSESVMLRFNPRLSSSTTQITVQVSVDCPANIGANSACARLLNDGSCHCVTRVARNWIASRDFCQSNGMQLVSFETQEEERAVETAWTNANLNIYYWISLSDAINEGTFIWSATGKSMTYSNWYPLQPDGGSQGSEDYVAKNFAGTPKWDDTVYTQNYYALCEANPK